MKLSELKRNLENVSEVNFALPNGEMVPAHFHITEVGGIEKNFIDCGGTVRKENVVSLQLWESVDTWHRLEPRKLQDIIELSESKLGLNDEEIEVEYQADTIGKYGLSFSDGHFTLIQKMTDCLAKDNCGIPEEKAKVALSEIGKAADSSCDPASGCC